MQTEKIHAEMTAKDFNEIMDAYEKKEITAAESVIKGMFFYSFFLKVCMADMDFLNLKLWRLRKP